jgi:hypothetical protein
MDPFHYEWPITYAIDGNMIQTFAKNMIAHFVLADEMRRIETICSDLLSEFEVRSSHAIDLFQIYTFKLMVLDFWNRNSSLKLATGLVCGIG